ncbi:orotidine-5'-phosphate decarboxylase [Thermogutta sp.]|jgi:orotidine-5'-phosphate decarboxylase|uniref:orotidine-5'-phosphate decarboxylase n=1 Tax=Thermogutta sp. TaxID=1962930 RepID=UPI003220495D
MMPAAETKIRFIDRLEQAVRRRGTPALVGIDPHLDLLPPNILPAEGPQRRTLPRQRLASAVREFCAGVLDVIGSMVPIVKFQMAFFEQLGPEGMTVLAELVGHARRYGLLVILDGKRGDIGSTAVAYAEGMLGPAPVSSWGGDAVTVSPYLGEDSLQPFIETAVARQGGVFVLVKTSNPGSGLFQDLIAEGMPLYRHVAAWVEQQAARTKGRCGYGDVGGVVGATFHEQLAELRQVMPHTWFLVPGYGAQGGTARDVAAAFDPTGLGAIVNNSRGILFAYRRREFERFGPTRWQEAIEAATREMIDQLRTDTPAGRLTSR